MPEAEHDVRVPTWPCRVHVPMDTDAIHPDAIRAAFTIAIDRLESRAEKLADVLDWSTLTMKIEPDSTEENTSRFVLSARRFLTP